MKKKIISLMMAAVLPVMMMAGCGSADNTQSGSSEAAGTTAAQESAAGSAEAANTEKTGDPYKIGVVMYQWTDAQGTNIQNFCKYLQENMNVEFEYESTFYDDDAQVSCVENLISSGCQAIISGYDTNIVAAMSTCADAGVYYVVALDHITEDDFAGTDPGQYFLGGTKQLLNQPEFRDVERVKNLLGILEEERVVRDLLKAGEDSGLKITIGSENKFTGIQDCSMVQATYRLNGQIVGTMAVLGPTRMEYGKVITVMDYLHKYLKTMFEQKPDKK